MKISLRLFAGIAACIVAPGCASSPGGWSTVQAAELTVKQSLGVGSSKADVEAFLKKEGIKFSELSKLGERPNSLTGLVTVRRSFWVSTNIGVAFVLGDDGKVEKIKVFESHTGP